MSLRQEKPLAHPTHRQSLHNARLTSLLKSLFLLACVYRFLLLVDIDFASLWRRPDLHKMLDSPWRRPDLHKMLDAMPLNDFSAGSQASEPLSSPVSSDRSFCVGPHGQPFVEGQKFETPRQHPIPALGIASLNNHSSCSTYASRFGQYDDDALVIDRNALDWRKAMQECHKSWLGKHSAPRSAFVVQMDEYKRWVSAQPCDL